LLMIAISRGMTTRRQVVARLVALASSGAVCTRTAKGQSSPQPSPNPSRNRVPASSTSHTNSAWLTLPPTPKLHEMAHSGLATINGSSLYYAEVGKGPPVLFLHGGMANSNYWGHQVGYLAKNFTVIVMDTRGHGRSPVTSQAFGYRLFAEDVVRLLEFLH